VNTDPVSPDAGVVRAVHDNLVRFTVPKSGLQRNEIVHIVLGEERLTAEVLRIRGDTADAQVFEDTVGVGVGTPVERTGELLSLELGPGLLSQVFDGLQAPLDVVAREHGFFLPRGRQFPALDRTRPWSFTARVRAGGQVGPGEAVGEVLEGRFTHPILVPFDLQGQAEVLWVQEGAFTVDEPVARIRDARGREQDLTLFQRWPVRRALPQPLLRQRAAHRRYPGKPLITTTRIIDTLFPVAMGGTACIPGPFGAGKTVLQSLLARFSDVDIVIMVACGERAGEVVETITEFPELTDPRTGGSLMDRTVLVVNTSSMPVAAREASIYTGLTLGEYYRALGYDVLLLADSTSRWAQALRETSGRLEEIPGEEAFPAYLDSAVKSLYERAGVLEGPLGTGSLTLVGTVSPAGGNFDEPVTRSTLGTVKTFLGLSYDRAYKRAYPAIDPLMSWSRYHDQLRDWFDEHVARGWTDRVAALVELLRRGDQVRQMMQVTGEEGISLEDFILLQKADLVDLAYLQQDAFDPVDASAPIDRQEETLRLVESVVGAEVTLTEREAIRAAFTRLAGALKNLNYAPRDSAPYTEWAEKVGRELASLTH
jgi:V/A-type H+/Na+-transporting ATPase subunit A